MRAPGVRTAQHRARYPLLTLEQAAERNREAQARYRERHTERLAIVRKIGAVLKRQSWHAQDADNLAADLHRLLGRDCTKALRRALGDVIRRSDGRASD
jgi:hypothetical protein